MRLVRSAVTVAETMNTKIAAWLPEVVGDDVVVDPEDVCTEARTNQWSFSIGIPRTEFRPGKAPTVAPRQAVLPIWSVSIP